jgi:hypothetical protein
MGVIRLMRHYRVLGKTFHNWEDAVSWGEYVHADVYSIKTGELVWSHNKPIWETVSKEAWQQYLNTILEVKKRNN